MNGTHQAIITDQQAVESGGKTNVDGVTFLGDSEELDAGKCAISIESVTEKDFGLWSSTLVSTNSTIFNGAVHVG